MRLSRTERRMLEIVRDAGRDGADCHSIGAALWPIRSGRVASASGGGDYAAQMMLGRLRKRGLVRVNLGCGSSRWSLTRDGISSLDWRFDPCRKCGTMAMIAHRFCPYCGVALPVSGVAL